MPSSETHPQEPAPLLRIYSWNVNGIRAAASKGLLTWLRSCRGNVVCLQETRARADQIEALVRLPRAWQSHFVAAERHGYSGVGLLSRIGWTSLETSLGVPDLDVEGRVQFARFGELLVVNAYFPNGSGKDRDNSRVPFKLRFYRRLFDVLEPARKAGQPVVVAGDFNTAHREIDLARPKQNATTSGFLREEREELARWLHAGWVDTFRHFVPGPGHYTWWSQRHGVREKNVGWRIDYALASPATMPFVRSAGIHPHVAGSDHCPVFVDLDPAALLAPAPKPTGPQPAGAKSHRGARDNPRNATQ